MVRMPVPRLALPLALLATALAVTAAGPVARRLAERAGELPACAPGRLDAAEGAASAAWFRLDDVLDAAGWLAGRQLAAGLVATPGSLAVGLPAESFAAGPVAGLLLVGDDDGARSRLRLVDPAARCAIDLGAAPDVVRSAVVVPGELVAYEHRVDRVTRVDLGVWRRSLRDGGTVRVLGGLPADPATGPTWSTTLLVAPDGRLVASACTDVACRVRVLEPATGAVAALAGTGPALGVARGELLARATCPGLPCDVMAFPLDGGPARVLAADAWAAAAGGPAGTHLVVETDGGTLAVVDVVAGTWHALDVPAGLLPVEGGRGGLRLAPGEVLLAPGGLVGDPAALRAVLP